LRIAVYENLPPGGALRSSFEIGRELLRRGHSIDLYRLSTYVDKGPFDLGPLVNRLDVTEYAPLRGLLDSRLRAGHLAPRSYTLFGPLERVHRKLAERIKAGGYDVVLLHPDAMTGAPHVLRWLGGLATVYYCQEPPRFAQERTVLEQHRRNLASSRGLVGPARVFEDTLVLGRLAAADRKNAQQARVIVVNSVYSRERVWAAYARNAVVCYLGIDPHRYAPPATPDPRRNEVLSVGGPIAAKGHLTIVEALALMSPRPALRVVIPRGADPKALHAAAAQRGVDLLVEAGLSEEEMIERYRHAALTVCAARLEPFGLTPIESLACGTPVVAIREAGYRETVVDGVTGILVEPDPKSIAAGVGQLINDGSRASGMAAAGREDVLKRWTWARTGDQIEAILQEAGVP
jgi:glycosyltransferase involved in cell wall biosynthesis